jgi:hypothetical protein
MRDALVQAQLALLLQEGALKRSACSRSTLAELQPLLHAGAIIEERAGAGRRLVASDKVALADFIKCRFPEVELAPATIGRVAALAQFRDSKALPGNTPEIVLLRALSDSVLWQEDQLVAAANATRQHGIFSFVLAPGCRYSLRASWALVENPALLLNFERIAGALKINAALYGGGRISGRLLDWLSRQAADDFRLVHFPDYDPVGLSEFVRLRNKLGARVLLHTPVELARLFQQFGNRKLLQKRANQSLMPKLRDCPLPEVRNVLQLIERHNAGLEQECLLFK